MYFFLGFTYSYIYFKKVYICIYIYIYIYIYVYVYKSIFPLELIDIGSLINGYQKNHFVLNETNV